MAPPSVRTLTPCSCLLSCIPQLDPFSDVYITVSLSTHRSEFATKSAATPTACVLLPLVSHLFSIHLCHHAAVLPCACCRAPLCLRQPLLPHSKPQPGVHVAHFGPTRTTPVPRSKAAIAIATPPSQIPQAPLRLHQPFYHPRGQTRVPTTT